nr:glycosyltransferase family 2 protein [uncultured Gemmiger sp.]
MQQGKIAAVVVTYNRKELLCRCLQALEAQQEPNLDILVFDNASTDGTEAAVRGLGLPQVRYRNTGRNLGGAGGFSYGIREAVQAGYQYLWIMDDDTLPEPGALKALLQADKTLRGQYGWLSSRALTPQGEDQPMNRQRKTPYRDIDGYEQELVPSVMASFVSLFLRTDTVRRLGLPIAEFFIWSDDWEYTRRISREMPCYTVSSSRVVHAMQNATVVNIAADVPSRWERYRYFYRNDVYLYRREGLVGWLWVIAKFVWHSVQLLHGKPGTRWGRFKIIWKGFAAGIRFDPSIQTIEE